MPISELSFETQHHNIPNTVQVYSADLQNHPEMDEGPYFTITPTVWILTMLTGAGMWAVFFYLMNIILSFIF